MTSDEYTDLTRAERRRYDYERNFAYNYDLPDFTPDVQAPEPTPEEDAAFHAGRREAGGGSYNQRED